MKYRWVLSYFQLIVFSLHLSLLCVRNGFDWICNICNGLGFQSFICLSPIWRGWVFRSVCLRNPPNFLWDYFLPLLVFPCANWTTKAKNVNYFLCKIPSIPNIEINRPKRSCQQNLNQEITSAKFESSLANSVCTSDI